MKLTKATIELLDMRLDDLTPESMDDESWASWAPLVEKMRRVREAGTVEALKAHDDVKRELYSWIDTAGYWNDDRNRPTADGRKLMTDLCRAEFFEVYDPNAVVTGRRRTMTVDGVKYEV